MKSTRRHFLAQALRGVAAVAGSGAARPLLAAGHSRKEQNMTQPNILAIVADDLGWGDVGYHGSKIRTPHIDRLVKQGIDLDQHYVCPMCTPTRACLMSGRYSSRFGRKALAPSNDQVLPFGTETLASAAQSVGYDTGVSGKWHLGSLPEWGPSHFGFKRSYGSLAGGVGPWNHQYKKGRFCRTWHRNHELIEEEGHVTDLLGREVVGWIREKRQPWLYYVPFTAVHVPVDPPQEWVDQYAGETFYDDPDSDAAFKRYAAYTTQMDHWIGEMVRALEETGQRKDTLILFVSDNGAAPRWSPRGLYPGTYPDCPVLGSNLPLRGWKGHLYEGGIRTPAFINWPGRRQPSKLEAPLHAVDWMPTLTRLVGYQPDRDWRWDGKDVWPLLTREVTQPEPRTLYFPFVKDRWAIRHGDWKLVDPSGKGTLQLFNLAEDPGEKRNLAKAKPEKVEELTRLLGEARKLDLDQRPADVVK